jgi:NitT/TauT family transport system substrate-binding protein
MGSSYHHLSRLLIAAMTLILVSGPINAEPIKIGMTKLTAASPFYIAQEKGFFTDEGLTAELVFFDSAQSIAVAAMSGDIDFGGGGLSAGFFNLADRGALRIIAGQTREIPGFPSVAYLVSNRAYAAGFKTLKDFPGHSAAVTQVGSPYDYAVGLVAEKYHFDLATIRFLPLQTQPNMVSAIVGGQADVAALAATLSRPLDQKGDAKILGWVGEETPWQASVVFTGAKMANDKAATVKHFLTAYRRGTRLFHDAFIGAGEIRQDGPTAPETLAIIAKYNGLSIEQVKAIIPYIDSDGRLDEKNVLHQLNWYTSRGQVKNPVKGDEVIDRRYAVALP